MADPVTTGTAPQPDPGGPDGPGTANEAAKRLAETSVDKPTLLNEGEVDVEDEKSERTLDQKTNGAGFTPYNPDKLVLPEGVELPKDDPSLSEFNTITKKHNLSQGAAQEYVDLYSKTLRQVADKPYQLWRDTQKGWQDEVRSDPEIGGNNFNEMRRVVSGALNEYGDPKVRQALDYTGAGNNPAIIRTFYRMARALSEGGPIHGRPTAPTRPASPGDALYPHLAKNRSE